MRKDSEEKIHKMILESLREDMLVEGLVIDEVNHTVRLTDEHNKGLDISLANNPICYRYNNMDIISIFKRTSLIQDQYNHDGNPFIYALKGIKNWKFDMSTTDIIKYLRRFIQITSKLKNKHFDTVITIPSHFDLNTRFMKVLSSQLNIKNTVTDYFFKMEKNYIREWLDRGEIVDYYKKIYHDTDKAETKASEVMRELIKGFNKMNSKYFESKHIPTKYLKFIHDIVTINNEYDIEEMSKIIDDKDIIILDDTISSGHTISTYTKSILTTFHPKSVTVVTVLSRRFK